MVVVAETRALAARPFRNLRELLAIGHDLVAAKLWTARHGCALSPLDGVGTLGINDAGRVQGGELLDLGADRLLLGLDVVDQEVARAPAAAEHHAVAVEIGAQTLRVRGHAAAALDALVADLSGILHGAFGGVVLGQFRQVVILPGDQGNPDFHSHQSALCNFFLSS